MNTTPSVLSPSSTPPSVSTPATASSERPGVATGAGGRSSDGDRSDELDRHALAQVDPGDAEVEEQVHRSGRGAEHRRADEVAPRPAAVESG